MKFRKTVIIFPLRYIFLLNFVTFFLISGQQIKELKGTDTFDTSNQIRNLMIRSGLSIDIIETASVSSTGNPFPRLFSQELRPSMSFDTGIVRSKARDDAKAVLMRNSDP